WIDVVETYPGAELPHRGGKVAHMGADFAAFPRPCLVPQVDAVGARILTDDQQLPRASRHQLLRFPENRVRPAADEVAAQMRDDAEGAAVIAALGYLQIAVVPRRQLEARLRHKVDER